MKKFNSQCLGLLSYVINNTGEYENINVKESPAPRRLNGAESAHRKIFNEEVAKVLAEVDKKRKALIEPEEKTYRECNREQEGTPQGEYENKVNAHLNNNKELVKKVLDLQLEEYEITVGPEVWAFAKKYFKEFGIKAGFVPADDVVVSIIDSKL